MEFLIKNKIAERPTAELIYTRKVNKPVFGSATVSVSLPDRSGVVGIRQALAGGQ